MKKEKGRMKEKREWGERKTKERMIQRIRGKTIKLWEANVRKD